MASNSSAGVYTVERDLSQRVRAVSTSIGAIVLASGRGPVGTRELVTNEEEFIALFGKPNPAISLGHYAALQFLKKSSQLYVSRVVNDDLGKGPIPLTAGLFYSVDESTAQVPVPHLNNFDDDNGNVLAKNDPFNTYTWNPNTPGIQNVLFFVCAANPGEWNNNLYVSVRTSQKALTTGFDEAFDDPTSFYIDVYEGYKSPRQTPDESFLVNCADKRDGYGNQLFLEDVINSTSKLVRVRANPYATPKVKVVTTVGNFMEGGTNGYYVSYAQVMRAWDLYKDPEHVEVNILIQGGAPVGMNVPADVADIQRYMAEIAQSRMDSIAVLDIPSDCQDVATAVAYRNDDLNLDSNYAAIYSPDVQIRDTYNDRDIWLPPSGFVAANYADTDQAYACWFAPAGMTRGSLLVKKSRNIYNQGHRDALSAANINAIRYFPKGSGYKVWGADTMQVEASALTNINVRRLLNFIEKSIALTAQYSTFEPNDPILRSRLKAVCDRFLNPIMNARGLYWFSVICDDTNNVAATVAAGDLYLDAYLDPVLPAKRIHLNAHILKTGTTYKESAVATA